MTSPDLPEQGDPAGGLCTCKVHMGRCLVHDEGVRLLRAEAEVKRLREAALAVVLTWDNEGSQHGIMSALREAVGYPPERPTREEAKARLNAYLGLPNQTGENG